jgi:spore cortex formation protein SpoVR/YcgB (stage V sporulation)
MNKARKKSICGIIQRLQQLAKYMSIYDTDQVVSIIEDILDQVVAILDDEETYFYNIPENLQNSERYEISEAACDNLEDAISELEDIDDSYSNEEIEVYILNTLKSLQNCI